VLPASTQLHEKAAKGISPCNERDNVGGAELLPGLCSRINVVISAGYYIVRIPQVIKGRKCSSNLADGQGAPGTRDFKPL
jgi:hypothetical protein